MNSVKVNELYRDGYRSLGCTPCTAISTGDERSGRWVGSSKCGGECGIHTRPLKRQKNSLEQISVEANI